MCAFTSQACSPFTISTYDSWMLICPARMDLISLPCSTRPASNFSSRKYSKLALRLFATTLMSSVINLYYHNQILCGAKLAYTHLRAHETPEHLVCRLLLEKKKK